MNSSSQLYLSGHHGTSESFPGFQVGIGKVAELFRYPVKSFAGEALTDVRFEPYGLNGDRSHAFIDPSKTGWDRYVTARQAPQMLEYRARFVSEPASGAGAFPPLVVTVPDSGVHGWDDALLAHLQRLVPEPIERLRHEPTKPGLLAVDDAGILLVTDASLRAIKARLGRPLDRRRFRANVIVRLDADAPFAEAAWIGRELAVGGAVLRIDQPCTRCGMIGLDPDGAAGYDASLLALLAEEREAQFGVYATVVRTGDVRIGDAVRLGVGRMPS